MYSDYSNQHWAHASNRLKNYPSNSDICFFPVLETRSAANVEAGNQDSESLPSYTIVSGLPSYEEALEQLKKVKELSSSGVSTRRDGGSTDSAWVPRTPPTPIASLSVMDLFQIYKNTTPTSETTTTTPRKPAS